MAMQEAEKDLEEVNFRTFQDAFQKLKRKGLITTFKTSVLEPSITAQGKARLKAKIPVYRKRRTWDGRIYMITYDVPEQQKGDREILRAGILELGGAQLQASVYITPYNPKGILRNFIEERDLSGAVIVSDLGKDGSIGEESLEDLVVRVYRLEELNSDYEDFISEFKSYKRGEVSPMKASFAFYSVLSKDPQLPFQLLPAWWRGEEAYRLFKKLTSR